MVERVRCNQCGNAIPSWANSACPVCARIEQEHVRYGDRTIRKPTIRTLCDCINGTWKHQDIVITFDFDEGTYTQLVNGQVTNRSLTFCSEKANSLTFTIGTAHVSAYVADDGTLVVERKKRMAFVSWVDGERKMCPQCFYRNTASTSKCEECSFAWRLA